MNRIRLLCIVLCAALFLGGCSPTAAIDITPSDTTLSKGTVWKVEDFAEKLIGYTSAQERLSKMTLVGKDGAAELYFDPATCDIAYKTSEGLYFSTPWDLSVDTKSVETQKVKIASQLRLSFIDTKQTVSEIFSFPECVAKGQYTLERLDNGVQVNMIIGRAEQRTLLPAVMTAESYERVSEALSGRAKTRLKAFYKLYDIETTAKNQIDAIAEKYPVVQEMPIYVLKNVTDNEKAELEKYFGEAGYTFEDMEKDLETVGASEEETVSPRFVISIRYELTKGELAVTIPTELIEYDEKNFTLLEIGTLEYFAAAPCKDDGYILIPDGSGAVIGFNNKGEKLGNDIKIPIYGYDRSLTYTAGNENLMTAPLPVFGIKSALGTMLAMVDEGAAMTDIIASSGGNDSGYAKAGAVFSYSDYDSFDYKDVNTQYSWTLAEDNHYNGIYRINYKMLDAGDGYSEMAEYYRERLSLKQKASEKVKLVLGLYGSVEHRDEFLFIPVDRQVALTTFEDAEIIVDEMLEKGIESIDLRYIGWSKSGLDGRVFTSASVQGVIGGRSDLKKLKGALEAKNIGLYLDADIAYVSQNGLFDGFTAVSDTSRMLDNTYAGYNEVRLSSGLMNEGKFMYAVRPEAMWRIFNKYINSYNKLGLNGISFGSLGGNLNSDKDSKNGVCRGTAEAYTREILKKSAENYNVMTLGANSYAYDSAKLLLDIPSAASGYPDADYSVPFLQMVLHGSIDYTTTAVNLSGDFHTEVLKAIENGSGLYFELAYRNAELLKDSAHTDKYSVDYNIWKEEITECYSMINTAIGDLTDERITQHRHIADGVSMVEYSSGAVIYVNYNESDVTVQGITVPKYSYIRTEKGE